MTIRSSFVSVSWTTSTETIAGEEFAVQGVDHVLQFDCVTSETHENTATLTEKAVERGAPLADHKRSNPARISIEATVTNTPIALPPPSGGDAFPVFIESHRSEAADAVVRVYTGSFDRMLDVHAVLDSLVDSPTFVTITTRTKTYENAQITGVTVPRKSEDGDAITITISATVVRIAESRQVDIASPREPRGRSTRDNGTQGTAEESRLTSILAQGADQVTADNADAVLTSIQNMIGGGA